MLDSNDVERRICEMLDMDDEELKAELKKHLLLSDERHQKIDESLEEIIQDIDMLLTRIDEAEDEAQKDEQEKSSIR
jgi:DNA anti-recombination protein RmuC